MPEVNPVIKAVAKRLCWDESKCTEPHDCPCKEIESCTGWNSWISEAEAAVEALYSALEREGWQVVPGYPTDEMQDEADKANAVDDYGWPDIWTSMTSAAPKPPGAG